MVAKIILREKYFHKRCIQPYYSQEKCPGEKENVMTVSEECDKECKKEEAIKIINNSNAG